jgi:hypothetical protein
MSTSSVSLPCDVIVRELRRVNLNHQSEVLNFLNQFGNLYRQFELPLVDLHFDHSPLQSHSGPVHWHHAALHMRAVRAATNHWLNHLNDHDVVQAWSDEDFLVHDAESAWESLVHVVQAGLASSVPVVSIAIESDGSRSVQTSTKDPSDLFEALCVQIQQMTAIGHLPHTCENDLCRNLFFHQRGRTQTGKVRSTGVRFCSPQCARTQNQRDRRRRNRETGGN